MINLMKVELKKIFKKKSFLVVTIIFILYSLMVNFLYKYVNNDIQNNLIEIDTLKLEQKNKEIDQTNEEGQNEYIKNLALLELAKYRERYKSYNQHYLLDQYVYDLLIQLETAEYIKDEDGMSSIKEELNQVLDRIKAGDYKYFIQNNMLELKNMIARTDDDIAKERYDIRIKLNEYRLVNEVDYDQNNYLNNAIIFIDTNLFEYINLEKNQTQSKEEEARFDYLKKEMRRSEYILKNKQDINNTSDLRALLKNFSVEFGLFILIYVVLISGSIMSEEFNKGTIKNLLIKPYKRSTILLAKHLTMITLIPIVIIFMYIINLIIGGMILGFSSLGVSLVFLDDNFLVTSNVFVYSIKLIISILPMYLVLGTFSFALSTITASTSSAITLTFAFYLVGNIIAEFYTTYNIKFFKYLVPIHWDFSYLVEKQVNPYGFKPLFSGGIIFFFVFVILCITFIYFNKKDVKNI